MSEVPTRQTTAIIKPFKLDKVHESLVDMGVISLTVTEIKDFSRQKGHIGLYRGAEYVVGSLPETRAGVMVAGSQVENVISTIVKTVEADRIDGGKIFAMPVE